MTWTDTDIDHIYRRLNGGSFGVTSKDTIRAVLHAAEAIPPTISPTRIKSVTFLDSLSRYGNKEAQAIMEDGAKQFVFSWFDDEISFTPEEFVGLTIDEAHDLKQKRDIQYLRS